MVTATATIGRTEASGTPFDPGTTERLYDADLRQRTTERLLMLPAEMVGGLVRPLLRSRAFRAAMTIRGVAASPSSTDEELRRWALLLVQAIDIDADEVTLESFFSAVWGAWELVERARSGEPVALLADEASDGAEQLD